MYNMYLIGRRTNQSIPGVWLIYVIGYAIGGLLLCLGDFHTSLSY
jgi:hypothetical protein